MKLYEDNHPAILGEALELYPLRPWGHCHSVAMETSSVGTFPLSQYRGLSWLSYGPCDQLEEATQRGQAESSLSDPGLRIWGHGDRICSCAV